MANKEINIKLEKKIEDGKYIFRCSLPVDILANEKPFPLKQEFSTDCGHIWELEIIFQKVADTGNVSCFLILKREDTKNVTVRVNIFAMFSSKHSDYSCIQDFHLKMMPKSEERNSIANITPPTKRMEDNQGMIIDVKLSMSWCHL